MTRRIARTSWLLALCFVLPSTLAAQDATLQGSVLSSQGAAVTGASVRVVGTDMGTFVNQSGRYQLSLPAGTYTVAASALG